MSRKLIFLMGPPSGRLEWNESEFLSAAVPPFNGASVSDENTHRSSSGINPVKWRLLTHRESPQFTDDTSADGSVEETRFLSTHDLVMTCHDAPEGRVLSGFFDHSFSIHETSRISFSASDNFDSIDDSIRTESMEHSFRTDRSHDSQAEVPPFPPLRGHLSNLKDIPNEAYLHSIVPQTLTVNLIVGILCVHPPRRVRIRHSNQDMDIVELIVGDETRTGFGVTFWLSAESAGCDSKTDAVSGNDDPIGQLAGLRPRDIILLRTVGLSSFRERVYGQSLRKDLTKINLLHRQVVDATDAEGRYSSKMILTASNDNALLIKVRRVRQWMINYVGVGTHRVGGKEAGMHRSCPPQLKPLPPDTQ